MDREGLLEISQNVITRRKRAFDQLIFGIHTVKAPLEQAFSGRNDLNNSRPTVLHILLDGRNDAGCFHPHQKVVEKPLFGALET